MHRALRGGKRQRGFAMIAIISLIALISAFLIANSFGRTSAQLAISREQGTMNALRQAKAALIAYAASEQWQLYKGEVAKQPGALPCPDTNDNGTANCPPPTVTTSLIGRLPWATLGIDDLRDASGERLWYALSFNFRKLSGTTIINSDTPGQLTATGTAPASQVVAIVFAPGAAIQGQNRPASTAVPAHNNPVNYLEGFNLSDPVNYIFTTNSLPSDTFNDRLIVITQADLMAAVEPVVAARIERDIKPYIATYFSQWNAFPFPSTFASPDPGTSGAGTTRAQSAYVGGIAESSGLLPLTATLPYAWTIGSGSVSLIGGSGSISGVACQPDSLPGWRCDFNVSGVVSNPRFSVQGGIGANAGISFANLPDVSAVQVQSGPALSSTIIRGTLTNAGVGTVIFEGTYVGTSGQSFRIVIPDVTVSPLTGSVDPNAGWFIANEWYRQTYYVVSPGYLPGSGASCNPLPSTPSCLTVNNMPAYYASPNTNKQAILIFAGRTLNGTVRPSSNFANYLEGENSTPGDFIHEHRAGAAGLTAAAALINDRVVVVAP